MEQMNESSTLYENGSNPTKASDKQKKLEGRLWMDSTLSKFDDILRINYDKTIEAFCDIVIAETCEIVGAISGSFFIFDQNSELLKASAGYGCTVDTLIKDEFKIGEGIVGQVAKSKKIRYIEQVPPHSVLINSGLGKISACALICLPLLFNEQVHGVIELISLKPFETRYRDLLERLSKNFASTLQSIQNNMKMRSLLEQLQQESQKKSAQEEELRQNMEEMAATQEQMRHQQEELQRLKDDLIEKAQELETTVQRFELAADTTTEGLWDLKIPENQELNDDTFFWWSDKFRRMLGFENQEDFPNRLDSWANLLHPRDQEVTLEAFDKHLFDYSGKTPYDIEYQLKHKNGTYRWYRAVGKTFRDVSGKPIRVAGTLIDIQDQKDLAELQRNLEDKIVDQTKELARNIQRFELAADTTTEGLWDLELPNDLQLNDDTFFWWSEKFRQMLGYTNEEDFPNRLDSWANLLHPDHKEVTLAAFNAHLFDYTGRTPYDIEYKLIRKTGDYRWYRAIGKTLRDQNGKPLRVAGTLIDIQDQKDLASLQQDLKQKIEAQTKELETTIQRFELAADTTTEGLWDLEIPENQQLEDDTFFWWSEKFRHMLGYQDELDFPNRLDSWSNLLHSDHKEITLAAFQAHLFDYSGQTPYDIEYQLKQKDGAYRWYRAVGKTLRDVQGKPIRVSGTLIDIQDKKDMMVHQDRLKKINQGFSGIVFDYFLDSVTGKKGFLFVSEKYAQFFEAKPKDFQAKEGNLEIHPDDKEGFEDTLYQSAKLLKPYSLELRIKTKSGAYEWFLVESAPQQSDDNRIIWMGYLQNIHRYLKDRNM